MAKLQLPTMGETKRELGDKVANILFDQSSAPLKHRFGLTPTLDGPADELWISPSDLLIPKVCLKPPLTNKYITALTHEGILAIGGDIDRRFWFQMEREKSRALEDQRELIMKIAEMERRVAIKLARQEEKRKAAADIENLMQEFEKRLVAELKNLEEHMLTMQDKIIKEAVEECDHSWRVKLEQEVNDTIERMTTQQSAQIQTEKKQLEKQFRIELQKQNEEFNYALKREQEFCGVTLKQLRHCLECKNLANLMYVLCMERRKCAIERCTLEYVFKNKLCDLEEEIHRRDGEIRRLIETRDRKQKQLDVREECLLEILKQFQKFINFALRAVPTQAEFLLSVEKMILYEAAKQTWQQGNKAIKNLCRRIVPWKSDATITESTAKSGMEPRDYHECLEEINPRTLGSDVLPYFYYKDKMYVRRDLQYYFDRGIKLSETNLLWNRDVENLMQILRATSRDQSEGEATEDALSCCEDETQSKAKKETPPPVDDDIPSLTSKQQLGDSKTSKHSEGSRKSAVSFQHQQVDKIDTPGGLKSALKATEDVTSHSPSSASPQQFDQPLMDNIGLLAAQDSLATIRMSRRSSMKDVHSTSEMETNQTLAAVQNTLQVDVGSKKNSLVDGGIVSFEQFQAIRILDEIELTRPSNRSSKASLGPKVKPTLKHEKESILQKQQKVPKVSSHSKLLHATDSLIIHRNSLVTSHKEQAAIAAAAAKQRSAPGTHVSHGSLISKLSFTRDSLELIRRQSIHSKKDASGEEVLLLSKGSSKQVAAEEKFQKIQKVVSPLTVSHIEVAKIPTDITEGEVRFSPIHEVYETNLLKTSDSPWNIYRDTARSEVKSRPSDINLDRQSAAQIVMGTDGKENLESSSEFTANRISSILNILKQDSSLIRLFTAVRN